MGCNGDLVVVKLENLDDIILESMGKTLGGLLYSYADSGVVFEIDGHEVVVRWPFCSGDLSDWAGRLKDIMDGCIELSLSLGIDYYRLLEAVLRHDGWVFGKLTMKTPAWMLEFCELSYSELIEVF